MPSRYGTSGNLFVIFDVEFPHKLEPIQIKSLKMHFNGIRRKVLPKLAPVGVFYRHFSGQNVQQMRKTNHIFIK